MEAAVGEEKRRIIEQREEMEKSVDQIREGYKKREAGLEVRTFVLTPLLSYSVFSPFFFVEKKKKKVLKFESFCLFYFVFHSMLCIVHFKRLSRDFWPFVKYGQYIYHISCTPGANKIEYVCICSEAFRFCDMKNEYHPRRRTVST